MTKIQNQAVSNIETLEFSATGGFGRGGEFVSDFDIRISNLVVAAGHISPDIFHEFATPG